MPVSIDVVRNQQWPSRPFAPAWNFGFDASRHFLTYIHPVIAHIAPNAKLQRHETVTRGHQSDKIKQPIVVIVDELRRPVISRGGRKRLDIPIARSARQLKVALAVADSEIARPFAIAKVEVRITVFVHIGDSETRQIDIFGVETNLGSNVAKRAVPQIAP